MNWSRRSTRSRLYAKRSMIEHQTTQQSSSSISCTIDRRTFTRDCTLIWFRVCRTRIESRSVAYLFARHSTRKFHSKLQILDYRAPSVTWRTLACVAMKIFHFSLLSSLIYRDSNLSSEFQSPRESRVSISCSHTIDPALPRFRGLCRPVQLSSVCSGKTKDFNAREDTTIAAAVTIELEHRN